MKIWWLKSLAGGMTDVLGKWSQRRIRHPAMRLDRLNEREESHTNWIEQFWHFVPETASQNSEKASRLAFGSTCMLTLTERLMTDGNSQGSGHDANNTRQRRKNIFAWSITSSAVLLPAKDLSAKKRERSSFFQTWSKASVKTLWCKL